MTAADAAAAARLLLQRLLLLLLLLRRRRRLPLAFFIKQHSKMRQPLFLCCYNYSIKHE
jgi:hypothetical protein